jgi:hypothetical protein
MSYGGSSVSVPSSMPNLQSPTSNLTTASPQSPAPSPGSCSCGCKGKKKSGGCDDKQTKPIVYDPKVLPDFSRMTQAEKLAYNRLKRDHIFGQIGPKR